ncbi:MAG: hypothetical protein OJJ21_23360 [Ferrovibrio sp.]|uniref:hypothetical protein n=1 Tax=Ferrovibrio sp. TaxID=1917215 RepID=UPI00262A143E|nr:hypothetical protein [Ferrovibrio sp.]MCW0236555.1 hypothetical protein [Ferrovibrio sp.]
MTIVNLQIRSDRAPDRIERDPAGSDGIELDRIGFERDRTGFEQDRTGIQLAAIRPRAGSGGPQLLE